MRMGDEKIMKMKLDILGYRVEYAWNKYPDDRLAILKKYAKTYDQAYAILENIKNRHYYNVRILPIYKKKPSCLP